MCRWLRLRPYRFIVTLAVAVMVISRVRIYHRLRSTSVNDQASYLRYSSYATSHSNYRIWPDALLERMRMPTSISLFLIALLPYFVGGALAMPFGFFGYYARTPAVYLGCLGLPLVIGAIKWGSSRAHYDYEQLRPIFPISDYLYYQIMDEWFSRFRNIKGTLLAALGMFSTITIALVTAYVTSDNTRRRLHLEALRPRLFVPEWYSHEFRLLGFIILWLWGALISLALASGMRLLVLNIRFMARLRQLPV